MKNKRFTTMPYIRYSNCYEDVNTLFETLKKLKTKGKTYLSICSGFDNTLALLSTNPTHIYAFDYNDAQIYLANLKLTAYKYLTYDELLNILGFDDNVKNRIINYQKISSYLDMDTKNYFDSNLELITNIGIVNSGRFEYYLQLFHKKVLPLMHSKKTINQFMLAPTIELQRSIYYNKFNNRRFKFIFRHFFSSKNMSKLGRDKSYFTYASDDVSIKLKERIDVGFTSVLNIINPYMQYIILGKFYTLPYYLRKDKYEQIKSNLDKVTLIKGDLNTIKDLNITFDFLNLSDIFEYMSEEETKESENIIKSITNNKGRIVFWNMIVKREFSDHCFHLLDSKKLLIQERPFFYQKVWRYEKHDN